MKSLAIVAVLVIVTPIVSIMYMNECVNSMLTYVQPVQASFGSVPALITIPGSEDANSASDALQTVSGINVYQNSNERVQE